MPRKGKVPKREILPDPKYHSKLIAKFVNSVMWDGKKSNAEIILYDALEIMARKSGGDDPLKLFEKAVDNVKPVLEVRSRRVGGSTYQVPVEIRPERRQALAIRWLIQYARSRGEKSMKEKLAAELLDAAYNKGSSVKKKEDTHKMADANKAFAHYRW
jgi:small subunit ribosomal protein S7